MQANSLGLIDLMPLPITVTPQPAGFLKLLLSGVALCAMLASPAYANDQRNQPAAVARESTTAGEKLATPVVKPGLAGSFLSSRFAKNHQDLKAAAVHLKEALEHDPSNLRLTHEAMRMSLLAGDVPQAIAFANILKKDAKTDALVSTLLMLEAVKAGKHDAANKFVAEAPGGGLYGIVRPVMTEWLDIAGGDVVGQADMQPAIDKAGFFAPFLTYHMALMNDVLGNDHAAAEAYMKASADPESTPYRVVEALANFYARQGKWAEAQGVFDAYARANPDSSLLPERLKPTKKEVRPLVGDANEGLAELFFTTASILFGEESTQDTFLYLRIALDLRPNLPPAQLMLANLYEQVEDYKQAIATYDAMEKGNVFYRRGQVRKALNLEAMGQRANAIAQLDKLSREYKTDALAVITKGDMLREDQKFDDAVDAYTEALKRSEPLQNSDWPLLYARGISYERAGVWDNAEADFKRALELEPNQPDVLNYLAYSWLMMNKNIKQAREYLETALAARPDDAHIIDSVGWAQYLSGDFGSAVASFEKAVELMPDDPTVNDHLGDAYWRVGRQTEAQFQWKRALTFKPEKESAEAIRNKLENGLPPFLDQQSAIVKQETAPAMATAPFQTQVR